MLHMPTKHLLNYIRVTVLYKKNRSYHFTKKNLKKMFAYPPPPIAPCCIVSSKILAKTHYIPQCLIVSSTFRQTLPYIGPFHGHCFKRFSVTTTLFDNNIPSTTCWTPAECAMLHTESSQYPTRLHQPAYTVSKIVNKGSYALYFIDALINHFEVLLQNLYQSPVSCVQKMILDLWK